MMTIRMDDNSDEGLRLLAEIAFKKDYAKLLRESIAMGTVDIDNIDTEKLFSKLKFGNKKVVFDAERQAALFAQFKAINEDLQKKENRAIIIKSFFYDAVADIFRLYYTSNHRDWKLHDLDNENFPLFMSPEMRKFTVDYYPLFEQIVRHEASIDLGDLISAEPVAPVTKAIYVNIKLILTEIFLEKLKDGKDITKKLFNDLPSQERQVPQRFKDICDSKGDKLLLKNTDIESIAIILCVFDCIDFIDIEHKRLFNNRMNAFLSQ